MGSIRNIRAAGEVRSTEGQRDASAADRTQSPRTEFLGPCTLHAPQESRDLPGDRGTSEIPRTEPQPSIRQQRADSTLGKARIKVARKLNDLLLRRWMDEPWASNCGLARTCGVTEGVVRQWRSGEKSLPFSAILVLPPTLATELVSWMEDQRGLRTHRRGIPAMLDALEALDGPVPSEEVNEVREALWDIQKLVLERIQRLEKERR